MKKEENYGKECPKCEERKSINYANHWCLDKARGGVEMHWSCNSCGETFIK